MFPNVMVSSIDEAYNLTDGRTRRASQYTLTVMTIVAVIMTPIVLIYQGWTFWVFRKRISTSMIPPQPESGRADDRFANAANVIAQRARIRTGSPHKAAPSACQDDATMRPLDPRLLRYARSTRGFIVDRGRPRRRSPRSSSSCRRGCCRTSSSRSRRDGADWSDVSVTPSSCCRPRLSSPAPSSSGVVGGRGSRPCAPPRGPRQQLRSSTTVAHVLRAGPGCPGAHSPGETGRAHHPRHRRSRRVLRAIPAAARPRRDRARWPSC